MLKRLKEGFQIANIRGKLEANHSFLDGFKENTDPMAVRIVQRQGQSFEFWNYIPEGVGRIAVNEQIVINRPGLEEEETEKLSRWNLEDLDEFIKSNRWEIQVRNRNHSKK